MKRIAVLVCALAAILFASIGCESDYDPGGPPPCVPVDTAGVWDVRFKVYCWFDHSQVWTIYQNGCDVTIGSDSSDPPSGTAGYVRDGRLALEWWSDDACYTIRERISAIVDGDTMTGTYDHIRAVKQYPTDCNPGGGLCEVPFTAVRRTQANRAP